MATEEQIAKIRGEITIIIGSNTKDEEKIEAIVQVIQNETEDKSE